MIVIADWNMWVYFTLAEVWWFRICDLWPTLPKPSAPPNLALQMKSALVKNRNKPWVSCIQLLLLACLLYTSYHLENTLKTSVDYHLQICDFQTNLNHEMKKTTPEQVKKDVWINAENKIWHIYTMYWLSI